MPGEPGPHVDCEGYHNHGDPWREERDWGD
jgi:hypothetical protein